MIGGTLRFTQPSMVADTMRNARTRQSPRITKALELVNFYGRIELRDLASLIGVSVDVARGIIENATFVEGSRIYDDKINGVTVIGWME